MADKCARAEEGRLVPGEALVRADQPGKKVRKRQPGKRALAVEPATKKPKVAVAAVDNTGGPW